MELLERSRFLRALVACAKDLAEERSGAVVLVSGEAGIGKTTLLRNFTRELGGEARTHWGACDALFTPRPLGPLHDVAGELGGELKDALDTGLPREALFGRTLESLQRPHRL